MRRQEILFVSDVHLALGRPAITRRFLRFLKNRARGAKALYILGDLFDVWIGDDDPTPPNNAVKRALKSLAEAGTAVYFQPGNRDFLIGERFCREIGAILLGDYAVIDLFGAPAVLMHGDLLCTDDIPYQVFREKSHTDSWRRSVLAKPLWLRWLAARWYRLRSFWHKRRKTMDLMDVNQDRVTEVMRRHQCLHLIHGHTHRPNIHDVAVDGQQGRRFVLAAWSETEGCALCWTEAGYQIENIC